MSEISAWAGVEDEGTEEKGSDGGRPVHEVLARLVIAGYPTDGWRIEGAEEALPRSFPCLFAPL